MLSGRVAAAAPFAALGAAAILAGGATAAAIAYHPTEHLVWMVAYLVLVVGAMQWVFGAGQAWLAERPPPVRIAWGQWALFNLGNAGVIGGTLCNRTGIVAAGTLLFVAAIAWFLYGVRRCRWRGWGIAFRVLLALIFLSACIGLVISAVSHGRPEASGSGDQHAANLPLSAGPGALRQKSFAICHDRLYHGRTVFAGSR